MPEMFVTFPVPKGLNRNKIPNFKDHRPWRLP